MTHCTGQAAEAQEMPVENKWINERNMKATDGWGSGLNADCGQVAEIL